MISSLANSSLGDPPKGLLHAGDEESGIYEPLLGAHGHLQLPHVADHRYGEALP